VTGATSLDHLRLLTYCEERTAGLGGRQPHARPRNTSTIHDDVNLSTVRLEDDLPEKASSSKEAFRGVANACVGYRYYSPSLGRWANRDPIGEEGGMGLYALLGNFSAGAVDLLGMSGMCPFPDYRCSPWTTTIEHLPWVPIPKTEQVTWHGAPVFVGVVGAICFKGVCAAHCQWKRKKVWTELRKKRVLVTRRRTCTLDVWVWLDCKCHKVSAITEEVQKRNYWLVARFIKKQKTIKGDRIIGYPELLNIAPYVIPKCKNLGPPSWMWH